MTVPCDVRHPVGLRVSVNDPNIPVPADASSMSIEAADKLIGSEKLGM